MTRTMMTNPPGHDCPARCGRKCPPTALMCKPCWRQVPQVLRDEVNRTWRIYIRATSGSHAAELPLVERRYRQYEAARDAAIASVKRP